MTIGKHALLVSLEAYVNGDASAGLEFKVFQGQTDVTTLINATTKNTVVITDVCIVTETGGDLLLVTSTDADGKRIVGGTVAANGGIVTSLRSPHYCELGVLPKIFGPATGKTRAILHGYLSK